MPPDVGNSDGIESVEVTLLRPAWLLALPLIAYAWWMRGNPGERRSTWRHACDADLLKILLRSRDTWRESKQRRHLVALLSLAAMVALVGPAFQRAPTDALRDDASLIIALDLSASMLTKDIAPSRIGRAKFKIIDLLESRRSGDSALLVYAADAFAVTPLTFDSATINAMLPALEPDIMPAQGSNTAAAVEMAITLLQRGGRDSGDLVLFTDGLGATEPLPLAQRAADNGLRVSVLGFGTSTGAEIPAMNGIGSLQGPNGPVRSSLRSGPLRGLAEAANGRFFLATPGSGDIEALNRFLIEQRRAGHRDSDEDAGNAWLDPGPWLVLLCLLPAVLLFRKDLLFIGALAFLLPLAPRPAVAMGLNFDLAGWFRNADQRGQHAMRQGDLETAASEFEDPRWRAAVAYRQGRLEKALSLYDLLEDTESLYNRANTLVLIGALQEAVGTYSEVLVRDPEHRDAAHNLAEVQRLLESLLPESQAQAEQSDRGEDGSGGENQQAGKGPREQPKSADQQQAAEAQPPQPSTEFSNEPPPVASNASERKRTRDASSADLEQARKDENDERLMADEQWLRRVPDDPSGLLRRKFRRQYRERAAVTDYRGEAW